MKNFIIKLTTKVNGTFTSLYHESIEISNSKEAMNVYVEHITKDKNKARIFYDKDEAIAIGKLFEREGIQEFVVINNKY